tara:strand:+ start:17271 stop:19061 length:1791 start_codon:yes stop_codon:yes gene_type:complete
MKKRIMQFFLLISLLVSACSSTNDQTSSMPASDRTTETTMSPAATNIISENSETASSVQMENTEAKISTLPENIEYFKGFSSNFSEGNSQITRTHPFQTLDSFCTNYPPIKEEISPTTVEVKKGDSLAKIASKYDLTLNEILEINDISNPNLIFVGQEIRVGEQLQVGLGPQSTGRGITENSVSIVTINSSNNELKTLGFEDFSVNQSEIFSSFIKILNEDCGGFHGRKIDHQEVTTFPLKAFDIDVSTLGNIACLNATKEIPSVIVIDTSQFSGPLEHCIVNEQKTALITTKVSPRQHSTSSDNRLLSDSFSTEQALSLMLEFAENEGLLTNRSIAVIADDSLDNYESIITGLVEPLRALNYEPEFHFLNCEGGIFCKAGIERTIDALIDNPPDVLFPTLNPFSLPEFLSQMRQSGIPKPQIIQSAFNQQDDEQSTDHIFNYGGSGVADYYDGTIIFSHPYVENQRIKEKQLSPFEEMCVDEYSRVSNLDQHINDERRTETVLEICSITRYVARALYDAGVNPSRRRIHESLSSLGYVDSPGLSFGSFALDKPTRPSSIQKMEYQFPCSINTGTESQNFTSCILPISPPKNISMN